MMRYKNRIHKKRDSGTILRTLVLRTIQFIKKSSSICRFQSLFEIKEGEESLESKGMILAECYTSHSSSVCARFITVWINFGDNLQYYQRMQIFDISRAMISQNNTPQIYKQN